MNRNMNRSALQPSLLLWLFTAALLAGACAGRQAPLTRDVPVAASRAVDVTPVVGTTALQQQLSAILADSIFSPAFAGVKVVRLSDGQVLFDQYSDKLFNPASNMKLFTAAAALHYLGPAYEFLTRVATDSGAVIADTLRGNLYLIGSGDPSLTSNDLTGLLDAIYSMGIRHVTGDVICDDSRFDQLRYGEGWMWDDQPTSYAAPISALSINRNVVEVYLSPGDSLNRPARVRLLPPTRYVEIVNTSMTVDSATFTAMLADSLAEHRSIYALRRWQEASNIIDVDGLIVDTMRERLRLNNIVEPALYAGVLLREYASRLGIDIAGSVRRGQAPRAPRTLASHRSAPVGTLVAGMNKPSDNLYAELLLRTVGAERGGEPGTAAKGAAALDTLLRSWGLDTRQLRFADGSGMSSYDLVSPHAIATLLVNMHRDTRVRNEFAASLPIAGVDGTLANRMKGMAAYQVVRAKTGTISGVSTLSGYVTTLDGQELAFSIMMAHFVGSASPYRQAQDRICDLLARYREQPGTN